MITKRPSNFAHNRQVKHKYTVVEPFILLHTLVKLVDAEDFVKETIHTLDLQLKNDKVNLKHESRNLSHETYDPKPEIIFIPTIDPNNRRKHQFRKYCNEKSKSKQSTQFLLFSQSIRKWNKILLPDRNDLLYHFLNTSKHSKIKYIQKNRLHLIM